MPFDIIGARKAGYNDDEIADFLASENKFDAVGARKVGYSSQEIIQELTGQSLPEEPKPKSYTPSAVRTVTPEDSSITEEISQGVKRGWHQLKSSGYALGGLGLNTVGAKDTARDWLTEAQKEEDAAQEHRASVPSWRDISKVSDVPQYVTGLVAEQVPNMAETALTTLAGAAIGSAATPAGTVAGGITGMVGKQAVKSTIKTLAKDILEQGAEKGITKELALEGAKKIVADMPAKNIYRTIGGKVGMVAGTTALEAGGNYQEVAADKFKKTGSYDPGAIAALSSLATGTASGFIELAGGSSHLIDMALNPTSRSKGLKLINEVLKIATEEGGQEAAQEFSSILNTKINDPEGVKVLSKDSLARMLDAAVAGAVVGVGYGGINWAGSNTLKRLGGSPATVTPNDVDIANAVNDTKQQMDEGVITKDQIPLIQAEIISKHGNDNPEQTQKIVDEIGKLLLPEGVADGMDAAKQVNEAVKPKRTRKSRLGGEAVTTEQAIPEIQTEGVMTDAERMRGTEETEGQVNEPIKVEETGKSNAEVQGQQRNVLPVSQPSNDFEKLYNESKLTNQQIPGKLIKPPVPGIPQRNTSLKLGGEAQKEVEQGNTITTPENVQPEQITGEEPPERAKQLYRKGKELLSKEMAGINNPNVIKSLNDSIKKLETNYPALKNEETTAEITPEIINQKAHEAATSPLNELPEPTQPQKEAGNYQKGHVNIHGLDISIENPKGSTRSGVSKEGKTWETRMKHHYGYIKGTVGRDKDHIDTFVGKNPSSENVFVVNQVNPGTGKFDEHKVMLGFDTEEEAKQAYQANYEKGWKGLKNIIPMSMDEFKGWIKEGDTKKEATVKETAKQPVTFFQIQEIPEGTLREKLGYDKRVMVHDAKNSTIMFDPDIMEITNKEDYEKALKEQEQEQEQPAEKPPVKQADLSEKSVGQITGEIWDIFKDEFKDILGNERGSISFNELPIERKESFYQKIKPLIAELVKRAKEAGATTLKEIKLFLAGAVQAKDKGIEKDAYQYASDKYMAEIAEGKAEEQKKEKSPVQQNQSLFSIVIQAGGLDPDKLRNDFNWSEDIVQQGLMRVTKKGGRALDDLAGELLSTGQIPPNNTNMADGDYLLNLLQEERRTKIDNVSDILDKEEKQAIIQLTEEWKNEGLTDEEIKNRFGKLQSDIQKETLNQTLERLNAEAEEILDEFPAEEQEPPKKKLTVDELRQKNNPAKPQQGMLGETEDIFNLSTQESQAAKIREAQTKREEEKKADEAKKAEDELNKKAELFEAKESTEKETSKVIPYSKDLKINNIDTLPKGTGVRYLEVIKGENGTYIAKQWRRTPVDAILIDFGEKKPELVKKEETSGKHIEDAGEELAYNKRNRIRTGKTWDDISDLNNTLKAKETTKDNIWPKPDYEQMVKDGQRPIIAHIIKQVYDSISARPVTGKTPTDEDFKLYIDAVNRIRTGLEKWINSPEAISSWAEKNLKVAGAMIGRVTNISDMSGEGRSLFDMIYPGEWRNYKNEMNIVGGNKLIRSLQPGYDAVTRAIKEVNKGWPAKQESWQVQGYQIVPGDTVNIDYYEHDKGDKPYVSTWISVSSDGRSINIENKTFDGISSKNDPSVQEYRNNRLAELRGKQLLLNKRHRLIAAFDTIEEAKDKAREIVKKEKKEGVTGSGMNVEQAERQGPEYRTEGENVTAERLMSEYGFRGVNFGNWMPDNERQLHLNHAYDSFADLAGIMGIPSKAVSLNGMLGVAFGAQGSGNYAAHFVPGVNEINLTRTSGAGSLAHEWGHALDHYFATQAGLATATNPFLSEHIQGVDTDGYTKKAGQKIKAFGEEIRPEIVGLFHKIVKTMMQRLATQEEIKTRKELRLKNDEKSLGRWLDSIRRNFTGQEEEFDKLTDKIKKGDYGEGKIAVSSQTYLSPVLVDIRELWKKKHNSLYNLNDMQSVQSWMDTVEYNRSRKDSDDTHLPVMVETEYSKNSWKLDKDKKGKKYWSTNHEMFARAFDAFVSDTIEDKARLNTYLSHAGREGTTVPQGQERKVINNAFNGLINEIKTKETDNGVVMFLKSSDIPRMTFPEKPKYGINTVKAFLQPAIKGMKNIGRIEVIKSTGELINRMPRYAQYIKESDKVFGAYDPDTDTTFIIADSIVDQKSAQIVLLHEVIGHRGIEAILTEAEKKTVFNAIYQSYKNSDVAGKLIKDYDLDLSKPQHQQAFARELIAHMAETGTKPNLFERIVAIIKNAIRRVFKSLKYTDIDVKDLIRRSYEYSEGGNANDNEIRYGERNNVFRRQLTNPVEESKTILERDSNGKTRAEDIREPANLNETNKNIGEGNILFNKSSEYDNNLSMSLKKGAGKSTGKTSVKPEGGIVNQKNSETFISVTGKEYIGHSAIDSLSLLSEKDFVDITGMTKDKFARQGGSIYFVPDNIPEANSIHQISGEILLKESLQDNPTELKRTLKHELTHWRQIQKGDVPKAYYISPEESIKQYMEYLSDPAEVKARFNAEGKSEAEYREFMEELNWAKSDEASKLKIPDIGETKVENRKRQEMPLSYVQKELKQAKEELTLSPNRKKYTKYITKNQAERNIRELEEIVGVKSAGTAIVKNEEAQNKLATIRKKIPISDTDVSNLNMVLNEIRYEWTQRRLSGGLSPSDVETKEIPVLRMEVLGKVDPKTGKREFINPIIFESYLREKTGIEGLAVGPNEIDIDLTESNLRNISKLQKTINKALPNPSSPPGEGGQPLFKKQSPIPDPAEASPKEVNSYISDVADSIMATVLKNTPGNLPHLHFLERLFKNPLWYEHPVFKKIYDVMMHKRQERYFETFNDFNGAGEEGNTVVKELETLRKKSKKDYDQLADILIQADTEWVRDREYTFEDRINKMNVSDDVKRVGILVRTAYDKMLEVRKKPMKDLLRQIEEEGYENDPFTLKDKSKNLWSWEIRPADEFDGYHTLKGKEKQENAGLPYHKGINYVMGHNKAGGIEVHTIDFNKEIFTEKEAEKWWDDNSQHFRKAHKDIKAELAHTLRGALAIMDEWRGYYSPRFREQGKWVVTATRLIPGTEDQEYFRQNKGYYAAQMLQKELIRQGWQDVNLYELSKIPESIYMNIKAIDVSKAIEYTVNKMKGKTSPELLAKFNEDIIQQAVDMIRERGIESTKIHRLPEGRIVKGYMEDPLKVFVRYASGVAGGIAKGEASRSSVELLKEIDPTKEPRVYDTAKSYIEENLKNVDTSDKVLALAKSMATFKYLAFNPRSAFVNMTAMLTTVPAAIHQYAGQKKVSLSQVNKEIVKAGRDYAKHMAGNKLEGDDQKIVEEITRKGYDSPQLTRDALGAMQGGLEHHWSWLMEKGMWMFGKTEQWNRGSTMLAAYRIAKQQLIKQGIKGDELHNKSMDAAIESVEKAHAAYGKANLPEWALGNTVSAKVGQAMYVYGNFGHNYVQMLYDLGMKQKNIKAFTWALAAPLVLAGGAVFPFKDQLLDIINAILKALGWTQGVDKYVWDGVRKNFGKDAETFGRRGLTGLAGLDISGSLGVSLQMPTNLWDFAGASGGVVKDTLQSLHFLATGQAGRAMEKMAPTALSNILKGGREHETGITTEKGRRVWNEEGRPLMPSNVEWALRTFGFKGSNQAVLQERADEIRDVEDRFKNKRDNIYEEASSVFTQPRVDSKALTKLYNRAAEYNKQVTDSGMRGIIPIIKASSLKTQAKSVMKPSKKEMLRLQGTQ